MLANTLAKIRLSNSGYLPDYPYHLISDKELYDAFMDCTTETGYFFDAYPNIGGQFPVVYKQLALTIQYYLLLSWISTEAADIIPDWVYSYILGFVISVQSDKKDIHDLIYPLGVDNIDDDFDSKAAAACYGQSVSWIKRKNLSKMIAIPAEYKEKMEELMSERTILDESLYDIYMRNEVNGTPGAIDIRPATIFGEPHVVKAIRLEQLAL